MTAVVPLTTQAGSTPYRLEQGFCSGQATCLKEGSANTTSLARLMDVEVQQTDRLLGMIAVVICPQEQ